MDIEFFILLVLFAILVNLNGTVIADTEADLDFGVTIKFVIEEFVDQIFFNADYVLAGRQDYPPIEKDVTFWCIPPNGFDFVQILVDDDDFVFESNFDLTKPFGFIIHGWMNSFQGGFIYDYRAPYNGWMQITARDWAHYQDINIVAIDYSRLADYEYTIVLFENAGLVADHAALFIKRLHSLGVQLSNISLVGHSLGGIIVGLIGQHFNGKIGKIFGLDPAGPLVTFPYLIDKSLRLDPSDAEFVQVIHTNGLFLGSATDQGHADIYVNGGSFQPGCLVPIIMKKDPLLYSPIICDHIAAIAYFTASVRPFNKFRTTSSNTTGLIVGSVQPIIQNFDQLILGEDQFISHYPNPPNVHDLLGPFTQKKHGRFSLKTTKNYPYCIGC